MNGMKLKWSSTTSSNKLKINLIIKKICKWLQICENILEMSISWESWGYQTVGEQIKNMLLFGCNNLHICLIA